MRPGEFHRLAYRIFQAANAGKLWAPGWCYGCGHASSDLRWWIVSTDDPWNTTYQLCGLCLLSWRIDKQAREKIKTMTTFSQWLTGHETGPPDDPVAWLARQWKACEGNRPKVSSPTGIEKHLTKPAVAEQIFAGDPEIFIKGVHDAIAGATDRYRADKAREQAGLPATSSGDTVPPAGETNPATGKPVAVVKQGEWRDHPNAQTYGVCGVCGWALGIADRSHGEQIMCAAGHVNGRPTDRSAGSGDLVGPEGTADPLSSQQLRAGLSQLGRIELMLAAICISLGLPGDNPDALAGLIAAAAETDRGEAEALAMVREIAPAGRTERLLSDQLGPQASSLADFASWYGMADPAAQGGESDG